MAAACCSKTSKHQHPPRKYVVAKLRMLLSEFGYCLPGCDASHSLSYLIMVLKLYTLKMKARSCAETLLYIYQ